MRKVRAQERHNRRLTEQRTLAALKRVARIQDQQETHDIAAQHSVLAPSLRRHETLLEKYSEPSAASAGDGKEMDMDKSDGSHGEAAPLTGEGDTEIDEDIDGPSAGFEDEDGSSDSLADNIDMEERQRHKKKKKGEGMRALIQSMRKSENSKEPTAILVAMKVPPIPAPKSKKPRVFAAYVFTSLSNHPPLFHTHLQH